jgi:hypothetical protein
MKKMMFVFAILSMAFLPEPLRAQTIALLNSSENTAEFFERRYGMTCEDAEGTSFLGRAEYERYFSGWKYILEGQLHNQEFLAGDVPNGDPDEYDWVEFDDADLTNGSLNNEEIDILILSNTASLSDAQEKAVQHWVLKGGKLIATFGSGYKDVITDGKQDDGLKLQKGGTGGLHNLWHDPLTKAFGTQSITPDDPILPGIDIAITKTTGPTAGVASILSYGAEANLLVQRQEHFKNAYGFLTFTPAGSWTRSQPAILSVKASKGHVVYFAFAPEFIVSLAFDLAGHCADDDNYPASVAGFGDPTEGPQTADFPNGFVGGFNGGQLNNDRVVPLMQLMKQTIDYMLSL